DLLAIRNLCQISRSPEMQNVPENPRFVALHALKFTHSIPRRPKDFLAKWLPSGKFSTNLKIHLKMSDVEVLAAIRAAYEKVKSPQHQLARRIQCREHFRRVYEASPTDRDGGVLIPGKAIAAAAEEKFGKDLIRHDHIPAKAAAPSFPVLQYDGTIVSSLQRSHVLADMPPIGKYKR
ncbi:MAG: hypothetical protein IT537_20630, partial [Hyphomicrobiales bacterium]|nr:hypothetical protein [Hyphomicrobiales bacterium]